MLQTDEFFGEAMVQSRVALSVAKLTDDLFVYRRTGTSRTVSKSGAVSIPSTLSFGADGACTSGFVDAKNLKLLKDGNAPSRMLICVLPDAVIESYRTVGFPQTHDLFGKQKPDVFTADPYALLVEQGMSLRNVVRIGMSSYTISDVNDDPLPVAMNFDYMNGYIDESRYDLKKAAKLLLARDDVAIFKVDWRSHAADERAMTVEEAVAPIPNYNSERGRSKTINFVWTPSVEDYRRMWKQAASYGGNYGPSVHRYQAMFDADVLGLRAGGAARFDDFHKSAERQGDDGDDD